LCKELTEQKAKITDLIEFLKPIESKAKSKGNSLDMVDLNWLEQHLTKTSRDSEFLQRIKDHWQNELAFLGVHILIHKCKDITTFFKKNGAQAALKISLKQENETRWNSKLIMLLSFPVNFEEVTLLLLFYMTI